MVKASVKTVTYTSGSRKANTARGVVAKAREMLRGRVARSTRAPLRTGGYYGVYNRRGRDELKFVDEAILGIPSATGSVTLINGVAQGTDVNNRIGRKFLMKSLLWRFRIGVNPAANSLGNIVRLLIVYDAQTNGALPAVTDILSAADVLAPMNLNNRDRFKIICDKWWNSNAYALSGGDIDNGEFCPPMDKFYKKLNLEVQNSGTANTIGSIATGAVYALLIAENASAVAELATRIRYTDS